MSCYLLRYFRQVCLVTYLVKLSVDRSVVCINGSKLELIIVVDCKLIAVRPGYDEERINEVNGSDSR